MNASTMHGVKNIRLTCVPKHQESWSLLCIGRGGKCSERKFIEKNETQFSVTTNLICKPLDFQYKCTRKGKNTPQC